MLHVLVFKYDMLNCKMDNNSLIQSLFFFRNLT